MGSEFTDADLALYQRVDEVLHYLWDPIGIAGIPEARDEYHGYLPKVFALLKEGADAVTIAAYLETVAVARMGFDGNDAHARKIADVLLVWRDKIMQGNRT
ncbi:hypothetical protein [Paraburkholderia flava]|uniref:hypothetical protein n=1 Tax=Paraburkholderia flava TaxID=2547393 RepID=UPI0010612E41|nr:hypothetical protein [Paraburkholderia flava]